MQKGQYDKAVVEYQKLVQDDPKDLRTALKLGDLYTRTGQSQHALETYLHVAAQYAEQGFFLKAVAVYKQILKLDPSNLDVRAKLAHMYELLSLTRDALDAYDRVAAAFMRAGEMPRALQALQRMVDLDPENLSGRIKYAEALSKAGHAEEAAAAFEAAAVLLKSEGRYDDYIKVAERLLFHRPEDDRTARELARLYLERNDPKSALAKLQVCFKHEPRDPDTLQLLAQAFDQLGQQAKAVSVYRELAKAHQDAGQASAQAQALREILKRVPDDAEASRSLAALQAGPVASSEMDLEVVEADEDDVVIVEDWEDEESARMASVPATSIPPDRKASESQEAPQQGEPIEPPSWGEPDTDVSADEAPVSPTNRPPVPPPGAPPPAPASLLSAEELDALVAECDAFMRFGLYAKTREQLSRVLEADPRHVAAREKMAEAFFASERAPEAIRELLTLAQQAQETDPSAAAYYLQQVLNQDPDNGRAAEMLEALGPVEPVQSLDEDDDVVFVEDDEEDYAPFAISSAPEAEVAGPEAGSTEAEAGSEAGAIDARAPGTEEDEAMSVELSVSELSSDEAEELERAAVQAESGELAMPSQRDEGISDAEAPASDDAHTRSTAPPPSDVQPRDSASSIPPVPHPLETTVSVPEPASISESQPTRPSEHAREPTETRPVEEPAAELPEEVEDALEEADFYLKQGLRDEARDTLLDALEAHPDSLLLREKLASLGEASRSEPPAHGEPAPVAHDAAASPHTSHAPSAPAPPSSHSTPDPPRVRSDETTHSPPAPADSPEHAEDPFLLAQKLAEELHPEEADPDHPGAGALDVDEVLAKFKQGVRQQIANEDTATHHDLGIAYMEMGLYDDAIQEFELCIPDPARACAAHTLIGLSQAAKGEMRQAIHSFEQGLQIEGRSAREETALYFELGHAYEKLEEIESAIERYEKTYARDPGFRDVARRLERLRAGDTGSSEGENFDELFESVILKD